MKNINSINIEKYNIQNDLHDNLLEFLTNYVENIDLSKWNWEYNSLKDRSDVYVAKINNEILGHYACINYNFLYKSNLIKGAKAEGSYVDIKKILNKYKIRDNKIFNKLILSLLNSENNKNKIIFGFPNSAALTKQLESGYQLMKFEITKYYFLRKIKKTKKIYKLISPFLNIFSDLYLYIKFINYDFKNEKIFELEKKDFDKIDIFLNSYIKSNNNVITIYRDLNFLNWRFIKNPYKKYKIFIKKDSKSNITGIIVFSISGIDNKTLQIQDILTLNYYSLNKLIKFSLYFLKNNNMNNIEIWSGKNSYYKDLNKSLSRNGFLVKRTFIKKIIIWSKEYNYRHLINDKNWFITMAFLRY